MPDYAIVFARSARKEPEALDPPIIERVIARIQALASDPRPLGSRKLRGSGNLWSASTIDVASSASSELATAAMRMDELGSNKPLQPTRAAQPFRTWEPARCGPRG